MHTFFKSKSVLEKLFSPNTFKWKFENIIRKKWFQIQLSSILNIVPNNYMNTTKIPPIGTLTFSCSYAFFGEQESNKLVHKILPGIQ